MHPKLKAADALATAAEAYLASTGDINAGPQWWALREACTAYRAITQAPEKKPRPEPTDDGLKFADWCHDRNLLGYQIPLHKWVDTERKRIALCFDELVRLDKRTPADIASVFLWCRKHSGFFRTTVLSPLKLRKKMSDGTPWWDYIRAAMTTAAPSIPQGQVTAKATRV